MRYGNKALVAWVWLAAGCGIAEDTLVLDLSDKDRDKLCEKNAQDIEASEVTCDGVTYTIEATTVTECVDALSSAPDDCDATVGDWSECADDVVADPCAALSGDFTPACTSWVACL